MLGDPTVYRARTGTPEFSLNIEIVNPELWNRFMNLTPLFEEKYKDYFKEIVFQCHKYLIRVTPIQTGRLRGGWTGILNKYNIDYTREFMDMTLLDVMANTGKALDVKAINEGMALSTFEEAEYVMSVTNNVLYGEYVEFGTSKMEARYFTTRALYKSEFIFKKALSDWFKEISESGDIVDPKPIEDTVM